MPIFESSRKVQVFGSSLAITLPAIFVKTNEVKKGSVMKVYHGLEGVLIISRLENREDLKMIVKNIIEKLEEKN